MVSREQGLVSVIIGVAVSLIVIVAMLPGALSVMSNSTGAFPNPTVALGGKNNGISPVNTGVLAVFQILLPIAAIVAIAFVFLRKGGYV